MPVHPADFLEAALVYDPIDHKDIAPEAWAYVAIGVSNAPNQWEADGVPALRRRLATSLQIEVGPDAASASYPFIYVHHSLKDEIPPQCLARELPSDLQPVLGSETVEGGLPGHWNLTLLSSDPDPPRHVQCQGQLDSAPPEGWPAWLDPAVGETFPQTSLPRTAFVAIDASDASMDDTEYLGIWGAEIEERDYTAYTDDTAAEFGHASPKSAAVVDARPYGDYRAADGWTMSSLVAHTVTRIANRARHHVCVPFYGPNNDEGVGGVE